MQATRNRLLHGTCVTAVLAMASSLLGAALPASPANATNACPPTYALFSGGAAVRTDCGTSTLQLTTDLGDGHEALSPDGSQVAFIRKDPATFTYNVWTVPVTGGDATQITHGSWPSLSFSWATSSRLLLSAGPVTDSTLPDGRIYAVNLDGTGLTSVAPDFRSDQVAACGSKIAATSMDNHGVYKLFTMNSDGSDITQITFDTSEDSPNDSTPTCTPDNRWVIYESYENPNTPSVNGIFAVPVAGGSPVLLRPGDRADDPTVSSDWTMAFVGAPPDGDFATSDIHLQWLGASTDQISGPGFDPSFAHGNSTTPAPAGFPVAYRSTAPPPGFAVKADESSDGKVFGLQGIDGAKVLGSQVLTSTTCQPGREVSTTNNTAFVLHLLTGGTVAGSRTDPLRPGDSYLVPGETATYCVAFTRPGQLFDVLYDISDPLARTADAAMFIADATPIGDAVDDKVGLATFIASVAGIPQIQKIGACLGSRNPLCLPAAIKALLANRQSMANLIHDVSDYLADIGQGEATDLLKEQLPKEVAKYLLRVITEGYWDAEFIGQITLSPAGYVAFETVPSS